MLLSAFGAWFHNIREGFPTSSPESLAVLGPASLLVAWWYLKPGWTAWWTTFIWIGVLNLGVGAILSVLPLTVWPFSPEQSLSHYAAHGAYLMTQLPALYALWRVRQRNDLGVAGS